VRGVRHELALGLEGLLQAAEQGVEGVAELLELVVGSGQGEAPVQVRGRDVLDPGRDRAQRPSTTETSAMTTRASPDTTSNWCRSTLRCRAAWARSEAGLGSGASGCPGRASAGNRVEV
jgi:hypothetical protein